MKRPLTKPGCTILIKKRFLTVFALLLLVGLSSVVVFWPGGHVAGVRLPQAVYLSGPLDRFRYASLINGVVSGDSGSLNALVNFWCGGGAGCYEHGAVIVEIMYVLGDEAFYGMARQLDKQTALAMSWYIAAGFEYGGFVDDPYAHDFRSDFPRTLGLVDGLTGDPE